MDIKVLGRGCVKCHITEEIVKRAIAECGGTASLEKVTSIKEMADYGVFVPPAVVVDGEIVSFGKIPNKEDIKNWLTSKEEEHESKHTRC